MKILFITNDKKIYYNEGKIKEVKSVNTLDGVEIRFSKPMTVYDVNLPLSYFVEELGNILIGNYTLSQLTQLLYFHSFILFVDHNKKKIEVLIDNGRTLELPYSKLEFLRYYFAKMGGILLESVSFDYLEASSNTEVNKFVFSNNGSSKIAAAMGRANFASLGRKLINNLINVLSIRRKQVKSS